MRNTFLCGAAFASALFAVSVKADVDPLNRPAQVSPRTVHLAQLDVTRAANRLVSVGERGSILLSDDGGNSWRQVGAPVAVTLTKVAFFDERHGWAVGHGGVVLATDDAGQTWTRQLDGRLAADIEVKAAKSAIQASGPDGNRLANAERLVADGPDKPFLDVHFFDTKTGIIVGAYGLAFMTHDGGQSWESIIDRVNDTKGRHLYAIRTTGNRLYLAGEQGALYRSDDRGKTFAPLQSPGNASFFGIVATGSGELIAFGLRGNAWRSKDEGVSWDKLRMDPVSLTAGIRLADGSLVLTDEAGRVLRTTDSGNTFQFVPLPRQLPFTGIAQAADGALVVSSASGLVRTSIDKKQMGPNK